MQQKGKKHKEEETAKEKAFNVLSREEDILIQYLKHLILLMCYSLSPESRSSNCSLYPAGAGTGNHQSGPSYLREEGRQEWKLAG